MSTSTSTNATSPDPLALRDRMHDQHMRLRLLLRAIDEVLAAGSELPERPQLRSTLVVLLTDLHTELPEHFKFEEQGGYFSDVMRLAPRMSRDLDRLTRDHVDFVARSCVLLDLSHDVLKQSRRWGEVQSAFFALSKRLVAHEQKENDIMQEVFSLDIGQPG